MNKKICLITGANAGIGKAAAIQIAQQGHHVIMACRNLQKGEATLHEVWIKAISDAADEVAQVTGVYFDEKRRPVKPVKYAQQAENIVAVMDLTMRYLSHKQERMEKK